MGCLDYGCCADSGHQCFTKSKYWGSCMPMCDSGTMQAADSKKEPWSCDVVGPRYTPDYRNDYDAGFDKNVIVEPWIKNCSKIGDNCKDTKCCAYTGYDCYEKDENWASCLSQCIPKKNNGGISEKPVNQIGKPVDDPPAHAKPTWSPAPKGPWSCKRLTVDPTPSKLTATTLYCWMAAMEDHGKGYVPDFKILAAAQKVSGSIFGCEKWDVFSDMAKDLNPGKTIVVDFPKKVKRPNVKLWVNTPLFMNVWKKIKEAGVWKSYDWTVKVDPYTVFVPQRLRNIVFRQPVTNKGVYLENCKHVRMGFHGSLEVISKVAWGIFMNNLDTCHSELPWEHGDHTHFRYYGEDKFLAWCLHLKGVGRVPSRQETLRVPLDQMIYGLHITPSCPQHTVKEVKDKNFKLFQPNCTRVRTAGMHSFKKPDKWMKCYKETTEGPQN